MARKPLHKNRAFFSVGDRFERHLPKHTLSQPSDALQILSRVVEAAGKTHPVTVKMRRGMDDSAQSERNFFHILDGALLGGNF